MTQATRKKPEKAPLSAPILRMLREAALYVLGAVALYLLVSLWTYSQGDPSWSQSSANVDIGNAGGRAGAWLADVLLNLFGYSAYFLPVMIAYAGFKVFQHRQDPDPVDWRHKAIAGGGFFLTLLGACGLAVLHFSNMAKSVPFSTGGLLGDGVGDALVSAFNFTGATIFLLAIFLAGVTLFTGLSWLRLMDETGRWAFWVKDFVMDQVYTQLDRAEGLRARRQRRETVAREKVVLERHAKPKIEPVIRKVPEGKRVERERQVPLFDVPKGAKLPPLSLLDPADHSKVASFSTQTLEGMARLLEKKLLDFNIEVQVIAIHPGPVITRFEIDPAPGIKASQITNLAGDLARSLSVVSLRVVENIPGKAYIGIEIPNEARETVRLSEILSSEAYESATSPLGLALGKDISGNPVVTDLAKMPHMLIAGTTGSGKSVCINSLVMSLVYKATPDQVRLIMVDPKMLELAVYEGIPHLLAPVVTDMKQAANALRWCIYEMERRYRLMAALGVRNISGYNRKVKDAQKKGKPIMDPLVMDGQEAEELTELPYIVILIDELADMMMVVGKKVEQLIARLAQKARAAGLHLILATQRPSVDVITGLIKSNIPTRIAFQMSARVDSRTVLDQMGAEQLLGQGDMLFMEPGGAQLQRVHGAFVSDEEVHRVASALKSIGEPIYNEEILDGGPADSASSAFTAGVGGDDDESDPLYDEAVQIVTETRRASISGVQRRLRIGYNRAARLVEQMERSGVVGELQTNGSREVLAPPPVKD